MKRIRIVKSFAAIVTLCMIAAIASCEYESSDSSYAVDKAASSLTGLKVSGKNIVDGNGNTVILRGIGAGEWFNVESYMLDVDTDDVGGMGYSKFKSKLVSAMGQANTDEFFNRWEANIVSSSDVNTMAGWGCNSLRISINYHMLSSAKDVYIESGFQKLDNIISLCKAKNMYVILALHAAPGAQSDEQMADSPDGIARLWTEGTTYQPWTINLWKKIAERYSSETAVGGYDLLDEPILPSGKTIKNTLRPFYVNVTSAIRTVDANHIIFIEGTNWAQINDEEDGYSDLLPAWDANLVWTFHKYWDDNNTAAIQPYLDLRNSSNRPLWNGETGENTNSWAKAMIALCEKNNIGWNMWTFKKVDQTTQAYKIKVPTNYSKMRTYLEGGTKPSSSVAKTVMFALADNAATSKCTKNSSYIKAVFNK